MVVSMIMCPTICISFFFSFSLLKLKERNPLKCIAENEDVGIRRHKHLPNEQFLV